MGPGATGAPCEALTAVPGEASVTSVHGQGRESNGWAVTEGSPGSCEAKARDGGEAWLGLGVPPPRAEGLLYGLRGH